LGSTGIFKEAGRIPEVFEKNLGKERVAPVSGCPTKIIHPPTTVAFTKKTFSWKPLPRHPSHPLVIPVVWRCEL